MTDRTKQAKLLANNFLTSEVLVLYSSSRRNVHIRLVSSLSSPLNSMYGMYVILAL
jgi:hypothetical protein